MVSLKRSQNLFKFYGYKRKLKTVKERVHQIKADKDQLTTVQLTRKLRRLLQNVSAVCS